MANIRRPANVLTGIREASWLSIGAVLGFELLNLLFFLTQPNPLFVVFLPWILIVAIGIFALGKLRPSDLGIYPQKILPALSFTLGLWLAIHAGITLILLLTGEKLSGAALSVGELVDQVLFFAITEEIIYRGYLFPQFLLKLEKILSRPRTSFWLALIISQAIFSLTHIPHRLINHTPLAEIPYQLGLIFIGGIFLCYVYLRSQNLLVAVGVHALSNYPTLLISTDRLTWQQVNITVMIVSIVLIEVWQAIRNFRSGKKNRAEIPLRT